MLTSVRRPRLVLGPQRLERRQQHSGHVLLLRLNPERRFGDALLDLVRNVTGRVRDLGQGESSELHHTSHLALGVVNFAQDRPEPLIERV